MDSEGKQPTKARLSPGRCAERSVDMKSSEKDSIRWSGKRVSLDTFPGGRSANSAAFLCDLCALKVSRFAKHHQNSGTLRSHRKAAECAERKAGREYSSPLK